MYGGIYGGVIGWNNTVDDAGDEEKKKAEDIKGPKD